MSNDIKKFKGYLESLEKFSFDIESYKAYTNDKRISFSEKKLLQSHLFLRSNNNEEIIELIENVSFNEPFFTAQKKLLLGLAYNNLGQCLKAIEYFESSIRIYEEIGDSDLIIHPITNIIFAFENINRFQDARPYIRKLEFIETDNPISNFHKLRCLSSDAFYNKNLEKALIFINKAVGLLPEDSKHYEGFVIIDRFNIYFQLDNYTKCEELIKSSQKYRLFKNSDNYKYLKPLIANLIHDKPIYIYKGDLSSGSILEKQILLLKSLSCGEEKEAQEIWKELSQKHPHSYLENFEFKGHKSIFTVVLDKYRPGKVEGINKSTILNFRGSSKEKLVFILKNYPITFDKYQMIKFLWPDEEYDIKHDRRLNSLISKVRKKYNIGISKEKGKYKISA